MCVTKPLPLPLLLPLPVPLITTRAVYQSCLVTYRTELPDVERVCRGERVRRAEDRAVREEPRGLSEQPTIAGFGWGSWLFVFLSGPHYCFNMMELAWNKEARPPTWNHGLP